MITKEQQNLYTIYLLLLLPFIYFLIYKGWIVIFIIFSVLIGLLIGILIYFYTKQECSKDLDCKNGNKCYSGKCNCKNSYIEVNSKRNCYKYLPEGGVSIGGGTLDTKFEIKQSPFFDEIENKCVSCSPENTLSPLDPDNKLKYESIIWKDDTRNSIGRTYCRCKAGFGGVDCRTKCPDGYNGINCDIKCTSGFFDERYGICMCPYTGPQGGKDCTQICGEDMRGLNCDVKCKSGVVDRTTNKCKCTLGAIGDSCSDMPINTCGKNAVVIGSYSFDDLFSEGVFNPIKRCECLYGFDGDPYTECKKCKDGYYGKNCNCPKDNGQFFKKYEKNEYVSGSSEEPEQCILVENKQI